MIELTLPRGALSDDAKRILAERLTKTVSDAEGMSDASAVTSSIWVFFDERSGEAINVGGRPAEGPHYRVQITVAEGSLDERRKSELVGDVTKHVLVAEGSAQESVHAARVWCHIHELPDGNWGAVGKIWRLREIAEFAGIDLDRVSDQ